MRQHASPPELLDDLYHAVEERPHWSRFLQQLAALFNANSATLRLVDLKSPKIYHSFVHGYDDDLNSHYEEHLVEHDPFRDHLNRIGLRLGHSREIIGDRDFERTEHYQQLFRPRGNFYAAGGHILRDRGRAWQIGVHRSRQAGAFGQGDLQQLEFFVPHLRRAVRLMATLDTCGAALARARGALQELSSGVWLLDAQGRCHWMNRVAEAVLRDRQVGLRLRHGRLSHTDARLAQALRRVQAGALALPARSGRVVIDPLGRGILATPLDGTLPGLPESPGVLLLLLDPMRAQQLEPAVLQRLYALTPAEARLACALAGGYTLEGIAAAAGISIHTARSQLKAVLRKTGIGRQVELVRTLLLGPACMP